VLYYEKIFWEVFWQVDAKQMSLLDFFNSSKTFIIPVYQRKYDWQQEHCQQLFGDIVRTVEIGREHFLGTFVYQTKNSADGLNSYVIIDGQQRITSLILLAKVLYEQENDAVRKEEILELFIRNLTGRLKNKCKLRPTEYDAPVFEKLMQKENFSEDDFGNDEKNSVLYKNYIFFRQKVLSQNYSANEIYDGIKNLNVVGILLKNENPQEIFESLNSTGKDLTESDLIRNFLLMSLDYETQEKFYKEYWLEIEKLLRTSDNVENFMVQYLITKRRSNAVTKNGKNVHLTKNNLYYSFKIYFEENYLTGNNSVEDFLKDAYHYAKFYGKVTFNADTNFDKLSELEKKFYELTFSLEATYSPIILMYLFAKFEEKVFDEQTFIKFTDALISLSFRAKICKGSGITGQFAGNVIAKLDERSELTENIFWQAITFGKIKYAFPDDEIFQKSLRNDDLYLILRSDGCKYLLYKIEKNSPLSKELPSYFDEKISVEHILPQRLNSTWKDYLKAKNDLQSHELLLHTLGNLTLTAYNSEISNSDFETKKKFYSDSAFFYTKDLKNYSDWTSSQIQARAKKLANSALQIWNLPAEYNKKTSEIQAVFTLDDDFAFFTGKKPETISVAKVELKTWKNFLSEVLKFLCDKDKNIFEQAATQSNIARRVQENILKNLDEFDFLSLPLSTKDILRLTKIFVENFDSLANTNFKDEIWFTLKKS